MLQSNISMKQNKIPREEFRRFFFFRIIFLGYYYDGLQDSYKNNLLKTAKKCVKLKKASEI